MTNDVKEVDTDTSSLEVLTTSEVAEILRISESHVCRMIKDGRLDKLPLGQRIIRVPRSSVNALLGI
jgi:excisionase family DNA binding protein